MEIQRNTILILASMFVVCASLCGQQDRSNYPVAEVSKIQALTYEEMKYPTLSGYQPGSTGEGVVVVRAALDESGAVVDAKPLAGQLQFVAETLDNIRKWSFSPNPEKQVILVYNFRLAEGECRSPQSMFTFERPNFITVLGCRPTIASWANFYAPEQVGMVFDGEVQVERYEEPRYPPLAKQARIHGVVVVQSDLDKKGNVVAVHALSGHPMLIATTLENAKKWRFHPNVHGRVYVVYNYKVSLGSDGAFLLNPNFVTISAQPLMVDTNSAQEHRAVQ